MTHLMKKALILPFINDFTQCTQNLKLPSIDIFDMCCKQIEDLTRTPKNQQKPYKCGHQVQYEKMKKELDKLTPTQLIYLALKQAYIYLRNS